MTAVAIVLVSRIKKQIDDLTSLRRTLFIRSHRKLPRIECHQFLIIYNILTIENKNNEESLFTKGT